MSVVFTEEEHRILLSALHRELTLCERMDAQQKEKEVVLLAPIVRSILHKVSIMQNGKEGERYGKNE